MHIKQLDVSNFRVFNQRDPFDFSEQFTVIAGVNGRGKTAILDAVSFAASRLLHQLYPSLISYRSFTRADINHVASDFNLRLLVHCEDVPVHFGVPSQGRPTKLSKPLLQSIRQSYGPDPNSADDASPLAVYYTTDRAVCRMPRTPKEAPSPRKSAHLGALLNRTVDFRDLIYRVRVLTNPEAHGETGIEDKMYVAIKKALKIFLPDLSNLHVEEIASSSHFPYKLLIDKAGISLSIEELSDGERALLALVTDLARRLTLLNPGLDNPLQGKGIVLIDELELHLHPSWQRMLIENLRMTFPNMQFIATTHSPFIIQTLRKGELILLDHNIMAEFSNRGIEEVTAQVLGVASPNVTPRYLKMLETAKRYYALLERATPANSKVRAQLKRKLDQLARPYADNPAYQAFLDMQKIRAFKE